MGVTIPYMETIAALPLLGSIALRGDSIQLKEEVEAETSV